MPKKRNIFRSKVHELAREYGTQGHYLKRTEETDYKERCRSVCRFGGGKIRQLFLMTFVFSII